ncbi:MAG: 30S ribosomal protein S4 [Candidatus Aenigmarchaeota archaeon]|nr:30S ribosomal protein S4 [Candidatus Aenigmarchaeota archaeon]
MGQPKKARKQFKRPKKPYDKDRFVKEKKIIKDFGLRRKRELWKAEGLLRNFRRRSRELLAKPDEKKQKELFDRLNKLGFKTEKLDDVLSMKIEDFLARRLQTIVYKKGLAKTLKEARQFITHRHVLINNKKIWYPSFIVMPEEENNIQLVEHMRKQQLEKVNK